MKKRWKEVISLVLTLAFMMSIFAVVPTVNAEEPAAAPSTDYKLKQVKLVSGSAIIEAEDYVVGKTVEVVGAVGAVGNSAVKMTVSDKTAPEAGSEPGIGFEFLNEKSGIFTIWARIVCMSSASDSSWVSVNGAAYKNTGLGSKSTAEYDFYWQKVGSVLLEENQTVSFGIIPRETGAVIDRIIVTNNMLYYPEGEGEMPSEMNNDVQEFPSNEYPLPTIVPPAEHPRLLFKASDLDKIRENMKHPENAKAVEQFSVMANQEYDGMLPLQTKGNYDGEKLSIIEAKAFDYALNGNEENGREAVVAIKNYTGTCSFTGLSDPSRPMGHVIFVAAEVYDWCYPLLTEEDKKEIVSKCQIIGTQMEIGLPPRGQGAVVGHGSEAQLMRDWLSLGIASYDEFPHIYNFVAGRYFSQYVPVRNYWYTSETHYQGGYAPYRFLWDMWAELLINKMTGDTVYIPQVSKIPYLWVYSRRPDGQILREGDDSHESHNNVNSWRPDITATIRLAANMYKDPILKKHLLRDNLGLGEFSYSANSWTPVHCLIINDPSIDTSSNADFTELPLTKYFGSPRGQMIARTGWNMGINSPDTVAYMKISELYSGNHNHMDAGNFQIYYKGILASESGYYGGGYGSAHNQNYNRSSIAHNTLMITSVANPSGVQRSPGNEPNNFDVWMAGGNYETGEVIGHEFGPDTYAPEYSYIAGDIAKAYDSNVQEALRSMIFMPTGNSEHPAAFVVFDKITTAEKTSKKTFALHMQKEPTVDGNVSIIKNDVNGYNGQLTNQTLLPKNPSIELIGGDDKQFMVNGTNYPLAANPGLATEAGWGRIEISETGKEKTDYFLNVMYVGDNDKNYPLVKAELIEGDGVTGAKIFDRVAMFNNNKARIKDAVSFTVPGEGEVKINVAGLEAGTWSIKANGTDIGSQIASEDGGIVYFSAPAGSIELSYASNDANKTFIESEPPYNEGVGIKLNENYIYSDVAPTIRNGRTLLPLRAIFEAMGAKVEWDAATATATAVKGSTTVKITENQTTAYVNGKATELDVPATIIEGRFVVPVRFVSESLGAKVEWDELSSLVILSSLDLISKPHKEWDIPNIIQVQNAIQSGDDGAGNSITNSLDGYLNTRWAAEGKDGEAWGIYDLGNVYTIDEIHLAYHSGKSRVSYFDIQVSEDGVTYTDVIKGGMSSGTTEELEVYDMKGVKARFVKYIGGGNSKNLWNSITEIVLTGKQ